MLEDRMTKEEFRNRKAAGRLIDVEACEIWKASCQVLDPYGLDPALNEYDCIGRLVFVQSADSDGPVWASDLPEDKRRALHARIERGDVEPTDDLPF
jgi:hypothetical protein